jgi:hypothetical protein
MIKRILAIALFFTQAATVCLGEDWMERLNDNAYLSQVSIPGTHDTATGEGWTGFLGELAGPSMGVTQDLSIAQQLDCGVRAFDLRPCVNEDELVINHGILQTKAKFPETLKQLCQFVTDHPTEFVVVVMRHESDGDDNSSLWNNMMNSCLNSDDVRPFLADYKRDITVGELRGKVLILSRDKYGNTPVGGFISGWAHQSNYATCTIKGAAGVTGTLYVQDFYEVMEYTSLKLKGIEKLLDFSTQNNVNKSTRHLVVCINCASGYTASASSDGNRDNAVLCNKKIIDYLADEKHTGPTGIIFMDFAGTDMSESYEVRGLELVNAIINNNQRYVPVKKGDETSVALPVTTPSPSLPRHDLLGRKQSQQPRRPTIVIEQGRKAITRP